MGNQPTAGAQCSPLQCPQTPWTHEHCWCCTVNLILQQPGKNRLGIKLAEVFYYWDFIFKSNGKYITGEKTPEV